MNGWEQPAVNNKQSISTTVYHIYIPYSAANQILQWFMWLTNFFTDCPNHIGATLNQITLAPRPTGFVDLQCVIHGVVINRVRHYWWLVEKTVHTFLVIHAPSKLINDTINCHFALISLGVLQNPQALAHGSYFYRLGLLLCFSYCVHLGQGFGFRPTRKRPHGTRGGTFCIYEWNCIKPFCPYKHISGTWGGEVWCVFDGPQDLLGF